MILAEVNAVAEEPRESSSAVVNFRDTANYFFKAILAEAKLVKYRASFLLP